MHQYSDSLIDECIKVFKQENGLDLSRETANEYLDSLTGLFLVLAKEPK